MKSGIKPTNYQVQVNPVRNSSGALNPGGIVLKCNPASEQRGIISNGVKIFEAAGCTYVRTQGDHLVYHYPGAKRPVVIPKY